MAFEIEAWQTMDVRGIMKVELVGGPADGYKMNYEGNGVITLVRVGPDSYEISDGVMRRGVFSRMFPTVKGHLYVQEFRNETKFHYYGAR